MCENDQAATFSLPRFARSPWMYAAPSSASGNCSGTSATRSVFQITDDVFATS